jgi:hypothetical protein
MALVGVTGILGKVSGASWSIQEIISRRSANPIDQAIVTKHDAFATRA